MVLEDRRAPGMALHDTIKPCYSFAPDSGVICGKDRDFIDP